MHVFDSFEELTEILSVLVLIFQKSRDGCVEQVRLRVSAFDRSCGRLDPVMPTFPAM